jgi:hypothetical protein
LIPPPPNNPKKNLPHKMKKIKMRAHVENLR